MVKVTIAPCMTVACSLDSDLPKKVIQSGKPLHAMTQACCAARELQKTNTTHQLTSNWYHAMGRADAFYKSDHTSAKSSLKIIVPIVQGTSIE